MLALLRSLFAAGPAPAPRERAPRDIVLPGLAVFAFASHVKDHEGFPIVDWQAVRAWVDSLGTQRRNAAWTACERAWILRFRDALGPRFQVLESNSAALLCALPPNIAAATLEFMDKTLRRIVQVLEGLAQPDPWGKDILIVFDDSESYYRYVSHYYPDRGEFAFSSGMCLHSGCTHYVTMRADLRQVEPTIAHEMTHGCLGHLPLPAWLNEGLAVNTEHRLTGKRALSHATPGQMHDKHLRFWNEETIQEFWSGKSYLRPDEGNLLSYDLARILVEHFARDWEAFRGFACAADRADAGAGAAREHLHIDLGDAVAALLQKEEAAGTWSPRPETWKGEPEHGGFSF